ncbi:MAG: hypothetical protein QME64_13105, partial [bacterium]|nr:hypothetical protein [bacterium]
MTGRTSSPNFPTTTGAFDITYGGNTDAFISKLHIQKLPTIGGNLFYSDINNNTLVDIGDNLILQFDRRMQVNSASPSDFYIPVTGDSFGTGATVSINTANDTQVVITLGTSPTLTILGSFDIANTTAGSPSGIDISAMMTPNAIEDLNGIDAIDGGIPGADDSGIDIRYTLLPSTTYVSAFSPATVQVGTDTINAYYTEHKLIIPEDSLATDTTITVSAPGDNHGELSAVLFSPPDLTFSSDTPAKLVLEYKEADTKQEAGYMETAMRIHQWKNQDTAWVLVPETFSQQSVDLINKTVSVKIDRFDMLGVNTTVVYANIALPSVGATTTTVAPAPSGFRKSELFFSGTTVTLSVTTTGIYT